MRRASWQFGTLVVLIVVTASASSQTAAYTVPAASVEVDFSFYHQTLSDAADVALANGTRENEIGAQIAGVATNDMNQPDATLHLISPLFIDRSD